LLDICNRCEALAEPVGESSQQAIRRTNEADPMPFITDFGNLYSLAHYAYNQYLRLLLAIYQSIACNCRISNNFEIQTYCVTGNILDAPH
jgi:hypothetical protein